MLDVEAGDTIAFIPVVPDQAAEEIHKDADKHKN